MGLSAAELPEEERARPEPLDLPMDGSVDDCKRLPLPREGSQTHGGQKNAHANAGGV